MSEKNERFFKVRGRSTGGVRFRGVLSSNGSETTTLRWSTTEVIRTVPESVYNECKADKSLVIVKIEEEDGPEAEEAPSEAGPAGPVDLSRLSSEELFAELERREAAEKADAES